MNARLRKSVPFFLAAALLAAAGCDYLLHDLLPQNTDEMARRVFDLVNAQRINAVLPPLIWSDDIAAEAKQHSQEMADGTVPFGHEGFADRFARITRIIPASAGAENVAYASDAEQAVALWMDSETHKASILGNYDYTGVGVAFGENGGVYYFTQIFIRSR